MVSLAAKLGYGTPIEVSALKTLLEPVRLPSILCNFIETLGRVELLNGATVVPQCLDTIQAMMDARPPNLPVGPLMPHEVLYSDHRELAFNLMQAPAELPPLDELPDDFLIPEADNVARTQWEITPSLLTRWNQLTRAERFGQFRTVDYTNLDGKEAMLVSYINTPLGLRPSAPQIMDESIAMIGAGYGFRSHEPESWNVAEGNYLIRGNTFTGNTFDRNQYLSSTIRQSMVQD